MKRKEVTFAQRETRRRKSNVILKSVIAFLIVVLALLTALLIYETRIRTYVNPYALQLEQKKLREQAAAQAEAEDGGNADLSQIKATANLMATQYDYQGAIDLLKSQKGFGKSDELKSLANSYQKTLDSCQPYPVDQITHVFFHSLVVDDAKAFDGDEDSAGYNQVMTTL